MYRQVYQTNSHIIVRTIYTNNFNYKPREQKSRYDNPIRRTILNISYLLRLSAALRSNKMGWGAGGVPQNSWVISTAHLSVYGDISRSFSGKYINIHQHEQSHLDRQTDVSQGIIPRCQPFIFKWPHQRKIHRYMNPSVTGEALSNIYRCCLFIPSSRCSPPGTIIKQRSSVHRCCK